METVNEIHDLVLDNIDRLPPMPQTVADVMQMTRSEEFSAKDLGDTVCKDPVLAARVLKLCNSGFYGLTQEVSSIQRAVLLLGFEMVKNLVFSSFVHSSIQGDLSGYAQTSSTLWEHSFGVATASLVISDKVAPELADSAYTAGLIHDIGKVVLATFVADRFQAVLEGVASHAESFHAAEKRVLGTTHSDVGALVAERWELAAPFRDVIQNHHTPQDVSESPKLAAVVSLGDSVCGMLGIGAGLDATDCVLNEACLDLLGLEGEVLQTVLDDVTGRLFELKSSDVFSST